MTRTPLSPLSLGSLTAAAITLLVIASGCTLRTSSNRVVRIELPKSSLSSRSSALERPGLASANLAGTSLDGFTCYGLNVIAPEFPNDGRMRCRSNPIGKLGGLVPVENGAIEMSVPAGPGRIVQLFAVTSTVGCPDLNALFDEMERTQDKPDGLGEPYLVGEARVDVFEDTAVQIVAKYDANSRRMFEGCSGGDGMPPSAAYTGSISESGVSTVFGRTVAPLKDSQIPSTFVGASDISGAAASVSAMSGSGDDSDEYNLAAPHLGHVIHGSAPPNGVRAAVQLQWDLSSLDLVNKPKGALRLRFRGGAEGGNCGKPAFTAAGVWDQLHGYWIPVGTQSPGESALRWAWGGNELLPVDLANLAVLKNDGKKYLIVNVESSFASSDPNCSSAIRVLEAGLTAVSAPDTSHGIHSLWAQANLPRGNGGGNQFVMPTSGQTTIYANGGVPPYSYSLLAGSGSIDVVTGRFVADATPGPVTVRVTDSQAAPYTHDVTLNVMSPGATVGFEVQPVGSSRAFTAGTCQEIRVHRFALDGTYPTSLSQNFTLTAFEDGRPAGDFYSTAGCTPAASPGQISSSIAPATSWTSVYFRPYLARPSLPFEAHDGTVQLGGHFSFAILAGAPTQLLVAGPKRASVGGCVPYKAFVADAWENPVVNPGAYTYSVSSVYASFFTNSNCTGSLVGSLPSGTEFQEVYALITGWGAAGLPVSGVSGSPVLTGGNFQVDYLQAGDPANLVLSGPTSIERDQCVAFTVGRADSLGTLQAPATSEGIRLYTDYGMDAFASLADCTARTNPIQGMSPSGIIGASQSTLGFYVRSSMGGGSGMLRVETSVYANLNPAKLQITYTQPPSGP